MSLVGPLLLRPPHTGCGLPANCTGQPCKQAARIQSQNWRGNSARIAFVGMHGNQTLLSQASAHRSTTTMPRADATQTLMMIAKDKNCSELTRGLLRLVTDIRRTGQQGVVVHARTPCMSCMQVRLQVPAQESLTSTMRPLSPVVDDHLGCLMSRISRSA